MVLMEMFAVVIFCCNLVKDENNTSVVLFPMSLVE